MRNSEPPSLRIVLDTNTLISAAILPKSVTGQCFEIAVKHFVLIASKDTWHEFTTRLTQPRLLHYFDNERHRNEVIASFNRSVEHVDSHSLVTDCADADDNKFLALALDGGAPILVTGDQDLLVLHPWRGIHILRSGDFVRAMNAALAESDDPTAAITRHFMVE